MGIGVSDYLEDYDFDSKWSYRITQLGFTMIPNALLHYYAPLGLKPTEFLVLVNIESYRWSADRAPFPSIQTLAKRTNLNRRSISRAIAGLEEGNLLESKQRVGASNLYSVQPLIEQLNMLIGYDKNARLETELSNDYDIPF